MKSNLSMQTWATGVWLTIGTTAMMLAAVATLPPVRPVAALGEIVLCGPLAVWLAILTARALALGEWETLGSPVMRGQSSAFWAYGAICVVVSACFLAGFVRGTISLALTL